MALELRIFFTFLIGCKRKKEKRRRILMAWGNYVKFKYQPL